MEEQVEIKVSGFKTNRKHSLHSGDIILWRLSLTETAHGEPTPEAEDRHIRKSEFKWMCVIRNPSTWHPAVCAHVMLLMMGFAFH